MNSIIQSKQFLYSIDSTRRFIIYGCVMLLYKNYIYTHTYTLPFHVILHLRHDRIRSCIVIQVFALHKISHIRVKKLCKAIVLRL